MPDPSGNETPADLRVSLRDPLAGITSEGLEGPGAAAAATALEMLVEDIESFLHDDDASGALPDNAHR